MQRYLRETQERTREISEGLVKRDKEQKEALFAKDGERDPQNEEQQMGRALHWTRLAAKLKKLNYRLHLEPAKNFPDLIGIYISSPHLKGTDIPLYKGNLRHLMGFKTIQGGMLPQFSVKKKDPTGKMMMIENRGWMKVVIDLVACKAFTLADAEKEFAVGSGDNDLSHNYAVLTGRRK
jgi:hypothetical protein